MDAALKALRQIKYETVQQPKADMWCHLGKAIIRGADEGNFTHDRSTSSVSLLQKLLFSGTDEKLWNSEIVFICVNDFNTKS